MKSSASKKSFFDEGSLDLYLKEISNYPLLAREDEIELAKNIKKGSQMSLEKLTRSNLRFVVSVAKKYQNQGVALSDLINEGNVGLIRAAHKFDETKGIKFISYAVWWIRQAILQALAEQSRIVRVPLNRAGTLYKIGKKSSRLTQESDANLPWKKSPRAWISASRRCAKPFQSPSHTFRWMPHSLRARTTACSTTCRITTAAVRPKMHLRTH